MLKFEIIQYYLFLMQLNGLWNPIKPFYGVAVFSSHQLLKQTSVYISNPWLFCKHAAHYTDCQVISHSYHNINFSFLYSISQSCLACGQARTRISSFSGSIAMVFFLGSHFGRKPNFKTFFIANGKWGREFVIITPGSQNCR